MDNSFKFFTCFDDRGIPCFVYILLSCACEHLVVGGLKVVLSSCDARQLQSPR